MATYLGSASVDDYKLGSSQVDKVYLGTTLVWEKVAALSVAMPDVTDYNEASSGTVLVGVTLSSSGTFTTVGGLGVGPNSGSWLTGGSAADVEVYATYTGGGIGGTWTTTGWSTWLPMSSGFYARLSRTTDGTSSGTVSLTFRNKNTLATLDTATLSLRVYRGVPI